MLRFCGVGGEPRALQTPGKHSPTDLYPSPGRSSAPKAPQGRKSRSWRPKSGIAKTTGRHGHLGDGQEPPDPKTPSCPSNKEDLDTPIQVPWVTSTVPYTAHGEGKLFYFDLIIVR